MFFFPNSDGESGGLLFVTVANCLVNTFWSISQTDVAVNSKVVSTWINVNRCLSILSSHVPFSLAVVLTNNSLQVDAGLRFENRKQKYQYMFNVKTPKRIYYLVAENEADMNKWVDAVCQVCGLKAYTQDEEQQSNEKFSTCNFLLVILFITNSSFLLVFQYESQESPPTSPTSTISGPYIPISECISGRRLNDTSSLNSILGQGPEHYDAPRRLAPSPPRSPTTTDAESVFTDDEWTTPVPSANWDTLPSTGECLIIRNFVLFCGFVNEIIWQVIRGHLTVRMPKLVRGVWKNVSVNWESSILQYRRQ